MAAVSLPVVQDRVSAGPAQGCFRRRQRVCADAAAVPAVIGGIFVSAPEPVHRKTETANAAIARMRAMPPWEPLDDLWCADIMNVSPKRTGRPASRGWGRERPASLSAKRLGEEDG